MHGMENVKCQYHVMLQCAPIVTPRYFLPEVYT
jgi:hypothetical protein